jgi:uncharacterized cupin superfamily protein/glyoxylase-like metal-dependent hydrolase (beta-lactamase superfamily II)
MITGDQTLLQRTSLEGISMWSRWQPDRALNFNSFFVRGKENVLVDPLALDERDLEAIRAEGVAWVVLTTRDHERAAAVLAQELKAKVAAPALDVPEIAVHVDRELHDGETLGRMRIIALDGMKSPGEIALHLADCATVILGDALWGDPPGKLRMVPDEKLADAKRATLSLRRIWALEPKHLLVGDGHCIYGNATDTIGAYLESRGDVLVNKINVDELQWIDRPGPGRLVRRQAEIGLLIGARKLGYQLIEVDPGCIATPLHAHYCEEELYYVLEGSATLRLPRGEFPVRQGDFIAFPAGEQSAHSIKNDSQARCVLLALSNIDPGDSAIYPDSNKFMVARGVLPRHIIRTGPVLDYYDGESG